MKFRILSIAILLTLGTTLLIAAEKDKPAASQPAATQPAAVPFNKKCPVSGDAVNPKGKTVTYKGKVVGFCCDDCVDLFNKNPDKYFDKLK